MITDDERPIRCLRLLRVFAVAVENFIMRIGTGFARWNL